MIQTIRVTALHEKDDIQGQLIASELQNFGITKVRTTRVYRLEGIDKQSAEILANKIFCESIYQKFFLNKIHVQRLAQIIEIAYKPGVMNPEVESIMKIAKDMGIALIAADSSWEYCFYGGVSQEKVCEMCYNLRLLNPTVEYIVQKKPKTLLMETYVGQTVNVPIISMQDEQLLRLSKDNLFLNLHEMKVVQKYFAALGRDPTDCELETIAQTWSEHCAHKTFKANLIIDGIKKQPLIKRLQKEAMKHKELIVSAFVDNSGVMDFYQGMALCGKVETHNSPSAIEPYGGAMTGSGGVFRDVLGTGLGAKTIASTDIFCFAKLSLSPKNLPKGCLPPHYLLKRIVSGVRDYGNRMGIPTNNGSIHFHNDFRAKPTIIVGAYGLIPKNMAQKGKVRKGDVVIAVGGRTGRDGIHGATFSSAEMTNLTVTVNSSAVQIGNAIEEKRMFDAILEARDANLINALQDCGAGGFSSAIGEMGEEIGVTINLSKVSLKYPGLSPWEIWVSESQERMIVSVSKNNVKKFISICKKYNVDAVDLGFFDGSKKLQVYLGKNVVCSLDMQFLHHGLPQRTMFAQHTNQNAITRPEKQPSVPKNENEWIKILTSVLSHGNVCSKEPIVRVYDHTVQGTNVLQPYIGIHLDGPSDAVVIRPLLSKPHGMIISHGLNPVLNTIDPYWGSIWASIEALSNYVAVGGNYKEASLINNYIWPFPDQKSLWSLDRSVDAVIKIMRICKIPVVSGKDSLSSTYRSSNGNTITIPPVLCMSAFGRIPDISKTVSSDIKKNNSVLYLLGDMDINAMGGSVYYDTRNLLGKKMPHVNLAHIPQLFNTLYEAIQKGVVLSCHDISEGGLITTLFEMCVGGDRGASLEILKRARPDNFLLNETTGCFVVEVDNDKIARNVFRNISFLRLGETTNNKTISMTFNRKLLFTSHLASLKKHWQEPMKKIFA